MADTGAPWNIPFVTPTDNPRVFPAADEAQALAVAAGLSAAGNAGIGSNVVQVIKTDTFTTSSSSFTNITGLGASITPSSNTAKVLVIADVIVGSVTTAELALRLDGGNAGTYVGDASGTRARAASFQRHDSADHRGDRTQTRHTMVYLDSPASASPVTYNVQIVSPSSVTLYVNRAELDTDDPSRARTASSITLIEVAV